MKSRNLDRYEDRVEEATNWPTFTLHQEQSNLPDSGKTSVLDRNSASLFTVAAVGDFENQRQNLFQDTSMTAFNGGLLEPHFLSAINATGQYAANQEGTGKLGSNSLLQLGSYSKWDDEHLRVMLNVIVCPIIIAIGTIGNIISFLTLIRPKLRHQTTAIYLAVLCINDLGAIWFGLLRHYLVYGYGTEVRSSDAMCKIHILFTYWFMHNSSILLATVGIQRYLFVCHNTRFRSYMTHRSTMLIIGTLCVLVFICELHYPIF
ncbi:hypothetical protein ACOME3_009227 [Neoechinorhynchus agilis]